MNVSRNNLAGFTIDAYLLIENVELRGRVCSLFVMKRIDVSIDLQGWKTTVELHPTMINVLKRCGWSVQSVLKGCDHITHEYCKQNGGAQYVVEEALLITLAYSFPEDETDATS